MADVSGFLALGLLLGVAIGCAFGAVLWLVNSWRHRASNPAKGDLSAHRYYDTSRIWPPSDGLNDGQRLALENIARRWRAANERDAAQ